MTQYVAEISIPPPIISATKNPEEECFPPSLKVEVDAEGNLMEVPAEPIAADLRAHADGPANAVLKLAAGVLGVDSTTSSNAMPCAASRGCVSLPGGRLPWP